MTSNEFISKKEETQILESTTGQVAQPRPLTTPDPNHLDPRFDRDDLRQGHPPPAAKKHLRIMKVKRNRKNKGKPYEAKEALEGVEQEKEADLTDEEVEVTEDVAQHQQEPAAEADKKPSLKEKLLG